MRYFLIPALAAALCLVSSAATNTIPRLRDQTANFMKDSDISQWHIKAKQGNAGIVQRIFTVNGSNVLNLVGKTVVFKAGKNDKDPDMSSLTGVVSTTYVDFTMTAAFLAQSTAMPWYSTILVTSTSDTSFAVSQPRGQLTIRNSTEIDGGDLDTTRALNYANRTYSNVASNGAYRAGSNITFSANADGSQDINGSTGTGSGDLTAVQVSGGLLSVASGTGPIPIVGLTTAAVEVVIDASALNGSNLTANTVSSNKLDAATRALLVTGGAEASAVAADLATHEALDADAAHGETDPNYAVSSNAIIEHVASTANPHEVALQDVCTRSTAGTNTSIFAMPGESLATLYQTASALTPNGLAISASNRASLVVYPGTYPLAADLVLSNEYVDVVSATGLRDVFLTGNTIDLQATHVTIRGLDVGAGQYIKMAFAKTGILIDNCRSGLSYGLYWTFKTFSGTWQNSTIGVNFCMDGTMSGTLINNTIGETFCNQGLMSGTLIRNIIGADFCADDGETTGNAYYCRFADASPKAAAGAGIYVGCINGNGDLFPLPAAQLTGDIAAERMTAAVTNAEPDSITTDMVTDRTLETNDLSVAANAAFTADTDTCDLNSSTGDGNLNITNVVRAAQTNVVDTDTDTNAVWGNITGTLGDQTDLNTELTNRYTKAEADAADTEYPAYCYAEIPLNPGSYPGNWTDYEIKIFEVTNTLEVWADTNMVYYYQTMGDPWDGNNTTYGDTNARAYFVDDHDAWPSEARGILKWSIYTNETTGIDVLSIADQLVSTASIVDSVIHSLSHGGCQVAWTNWQWYTNRHNLRASYIRYDAIGPQTNSLGVGRWQPAILHWTFDRMNEAPAPSG